MKAILRDFDWKQLPISIEEDLVNMGAKLVSSHLGMGMDRDAIRLSIPSEMTYDEQIRLMRLVGAGELYVDSARE